MVDDLEGASMPDGIDVDEAAAYFGVFESSDALHQMMEMPREAAFERFFALLSDLVLKPGEFDFKEASDRLSCEGGEIYFLVAGHLGVMSIPEQLTLAIEEGQFSEDDAVVLNELTDPMRLLKLFAIAYQTGGEGESTKYLKSIETMMMKPVANKDLLLTLASEMKGAFDVSGHVTPIPSLASESANASAVEAADIAPLPPREVEEKKSVAKPPAKPEPKIEKLVEEKVEEKVEESVPLPKIEKEEKIPLPKVEKVVEVDNRKETEKTEDAFSGAFGLIEEEPEPEVKPEITEELETAVSVEEKEEVAEESENSETDTSLEDAFAAADVDGSGGLSIEEVAEATGLDIEEAAKLHAEADVDGDGQVTLEELKSKPEVVEKMALPKPVKPVRAGVANPQAQQPVQQQSWQQQQQAAQQQAWQQQQLQQQQAAQQQAWQQQQLQQQQAAQQQAWQQQQLQQQQAAQQQAWQQQQQAQQQGWNQPAQPIQPTIQSGLTCRGCGIGVDANWRFCPVCGTQNR